MTKNIAIDLSGAILIRRLIDAFSVLVRDSQNRDKWPAPVFDF